MIIIIIIIVIVNNIYHHLPYHYDIYHLYPGHHHFPCCYLNGHLAKATAATMYWIMLLLTAPSPPQLPPSPLLLLKWWWSSLSSLFWEWSSQASAIGTTVSAVNALKWYASLPSFVDDHSLHRHHALVLRLLAACLCQSDCLKTCRTPALLHTIHYPTLHPLHHYHHYYYFFLTHQANSRPFPTISFHSNQPCFQSSLSPYYLTYLPRTVPSSPITATIPRLTLFTSVLPLIMFLLRLHWKDLLKTLWLLYSFCLVSWRHLENLYRQI